MKLLDSVELATKHELDTLANTARERNADAIGGTHGLEYWAVSSFGRVTWLLRVRGCLVTVGRADLAAVINAAKGGQQ